MGSKKKPKKAKAKPKISKRLPLINFKAAGKDHKKIALLAKKHAGGNMSAWLRHAALNYRPKKNEIIR
jgi:hypothetical protein